MSEKISKSDFFEELALLAPVPCLVVTNNEQDGLQLAAYQYRWDNGYDAIIQLPCDEGFQVGDSVRYKRLAPKGCSVKSVTEIAADQIRDLENARRVFLPQIYGH
jgi:hypothetical protein